jgi:hypothetical protein
MINLKITALGIIVAVMAPGLLAMECPKKIRVEAKDFTSISADNQKEIEDIYQLGDKQTEKTYIQAVLQVANKLTPVDEVVTYSPKASSYIASCIYRGKTVSVSIYPVENEYADKGYTARLKLGKIKYKSPTNAGNPVSQFGNALDLVTHLATLEKGRIVQRQNKSYPLSLELSIQIPLGDYGTDGYSVTAKVGSAKAVKYTVVE